MKSTTHLKDALSLIVTLLCVFGTMAGAYLISAPANDPALFIGAWVGKIVLGLLSVIFLCDVVVVVPEKEAKTLVQLGKFRRVLNSGFHLKNVWPLESTDIDLNLRIQEIKSEIHAMTEDKASLIVPINLQYRVRIGSEYQAAYSLENVEQQIATYLEDKIRSAASRHKLVDAFGNSAFFEEAVKTEMGDILEKFGYDIVNVLVNDPQPSEAMRASFEKVLSAERNKEAATATAEAIRIERVGEAKAEAESLKIKADAFVEFRQTIAKGNSSAMQEFLDGVDGLVAKDVLEFFAGMDERDAIRDAASKGGKIVLINGSRSGLSDVAAGFAS
ncbi:SPFH domain-containing protein [Roseibium sp. RKSG952]|uniref:SPFH domain-containing protein n=1 Tax=Roseibium sp. RKSG952 TaxID=2529384 RepID=UPI0012BD2E8A|nr:SPFH domain-containing protein [Roseibium sp. RKSG952]MTH96628.1 hypothetical protein [Roseibium sp. RKSG952]